MGITETTMWKVALEKHEALHEFEAQTISKPLTNKVGGKPNKSLQRSASKRSVSKV